MRAISLKAIVIGNIINFVVVVVAIFALAVVWTMCAAALAPGAPDFGEIKSQIKHSDAFLGAVVAIIVGADVLAGYVSAKLAKRAALLNSALAASALLLLNLYDLLFSPLFGPSDNQMHLSPVVDFIVNYGGPLFGMLGGYLAAPRLQLADAS
jgi:hypothetical protein